MDIFYLWMYILNLAVIFSIGIMMGVLPYINRKSLVFGVRVPESVHAEPEIRRIKTVFMFVMFASAVLAAAGATIWYILYPKMSIAAVMYAPLVILAAQIAVYIPSWKKVLALKNEKGWHVAALSYGDTRSSVSRAKLRGLPWGWYAASLLLAAAAAVFALLKYPSLPDIVATHWNAAMVPDAWADKSLTTVLIMPIIAAASVLLIYACNILMYKTKLQINPENPPLSFAQHRAYRRLMGHMLGVLALSITLLFLFLIPQTLNIWTPPVSLFYAVIMIFTIFITVFAVAVTVRAGQSGCRLKPEILPEDHISAGRTPPESPAMPERADDRFWKFGMFYYNPDDPAVLVENRFGSNSDFNYARTTSKIVVALILLSIIAAYVITTVLFVFYL